MSHLAEGGVPCERQGVAEEIHAEPPSGGGRLAASDNGRRRCICERRC